MHRTPSSRQTYLHKHIAAKERIKVHRLAEGGEQGNRRKVEAGANSAFIDFRVELRGLAV